MQSEHQVVFVTAPDRETALKLIQGAVQNKLAACGNLIPGIESIYWWQNAIETSQEVLIIFKTTSDALRALKEYILRSHPYEVPEFIAVDIVDGAPKYLE